MISSLISLIRTVLKRIRADRLVVSAALLTISMATVLIASGPIYADALTLSALQQKLEEAPTIESNLAVGARVFPEDLSVADDVVIEQVEKALDTTGADVLRHLQADSYQIGAAVEKAPIELASVQYFEGIETRVTRIRGRWPGDASRPIETAVGERTAAELGIDVGDVVELASRRDPSRSLAVMVVGVFEVRDPADPFWFDDDLVASGSVETAGFRTFGPFVVSRQTMLQAFTPLRTAITWRVFPHFENLAVDEITRLRSELTRLAGEINRGFSTAMGGDIGGSSEITIDTGLTRLLAGLDRSITVTRATVLAVLVQLAVLAGYALALTSGLIVDIRRSETALIRARGAGPAQMLAVGMGEAVVLTVPAAAFAPYAASALLRILNITGPLAAVGLTITPQPTGESFVVAISAALLAIIILVTPAFRDARGSLSGKTRHGRESRLARGQRTGVDLALVALAGVAFWQLGVVGPRISADVGGRLGIDPLLVVAPSMGLLAGAVLALRVVPLLARVAERIASMGRRAVTALASWQVARRPSAYSRSALLLIMAVAIGIFAAAYSTTWAESQRDQASHRVAADISLTPDRSERRSIPGLLLTDSHETVPGVDVSTPVVRISGRLASGDQIVQFLLIDAANATRVTRVRSDQAPRFAELMAQMVERRPAVESIALPDEPNALALEFEAVELAPPGDTDLPKGSPASAMVSVVLQDGDGLLHRTAVRPLRIDSGRRRMVLDLTTRLPEGSTGTPTYPLSLVGIEMESLIPDVNHTIDLSLLGIHVRSGRLWSEVQMPTDWNDWALSQSPVVGATTRPSITAGTGNDARLNMIIETGSAFPPSRVFFGLRPSGSSTAETYPVIVSTSLADDRPVGVGETLTLRPLRLQNARAIVSGTVTSFPTMEDTSTQVVIADLPTIQAMSYEPGVDLPRIDEYWLATTGDAAPMVAALEGEPFRSASVTSAEDLAATLVNDPIALGTIGALTIGFVAAAVFAAVGFAVSATVTARERLVEFALLRAVGLSGRQLAGWLLLEYGVLIVAGLGLGTLTGTLLTATVLPQISLSQDGSPVVPEVIVHYPWVTVLGLEVSLLVVLAVMVTVMTLSLRRLGLGSLLRLGEDP